MGADRVLVAFSSQTGSTAGIAETIAAVLRRNGLAVDCRRAGDVEDLAPYVAVVLGSGVFVPRRASDGGGFLARHARDLGARRVWLFCAGPIGRGRCDGHGVTADAGLHAGDCSVAAVARAIGARGTAVFGPSTAADATDPMEPLGPADTLTVRAWATSIARDLAQPAPASGRGTACRSVARRADGAARHVTANH